VIDVLVPILGRSPLEMLKTLWAFTTTPYQVYFICSPNDDQIATCQASGHVTWVVDWEPGRADFAKKINWAFARTNSEWVFQGADDIRFSPNWDVEALKVSARAGVIGTNDLHNPSVKAGHSATHILFRRSYIEDYGGTFDGSGAVFSEAYDHQWCNPPEAPIWMGDLSFRCLGEIEVGDEVIGWERRQKDDTKHSLNYLCISRVLDITEREAPLMEVTFESGRSLICTPDHLWLNGNWSPSTPRHVEWVTPRVGSSLVHVAEESRQLAGEELRLAGWLGGIYDGEGSGMYAALQSETANPEVVAEIDRVLTLLDIPFTRGIRPEQGRYGTDVTEFILTGGRRAYLDFILLTQPVKRETMMKRILNHARFGQKDKIADVTLAGQGTVLSMTTTTGNYVAWGYASKNCDNELIELAKSRNQWAFAKHSVVEHLHPVWGLAEWDPTYEKAFRETSQDQRLFWKRKRAWGGKLSQPEIHELELAEQAGIV